MGDLATWERLTGKKLLWRIDEQPKPLEVHDVLDESNYSPATQSRMLASLRQFHKWGASRELWPLNGIASIPSPTVQSEKWPPLTNEQVAWLLDRATESAERRVMLLGLFAATRISEAANMKPSHMLSDRLRFPAKGKGGGGRTREIPLVSALSNERQLIFSRPVTLRQLKWTVEKMQKDSPFQWTSHSLRRTFSQRLLDRGVEVAVVEELMGHVHRSTTLQSYGYVPWPRQVEAMKVLEEHHQMALW
jgi:site-specific recombinase XerD